MEGLEPASFLEITSIPALNLEQRLGYLIRYPHGCGEQITSAVFPQLMLDRIMDLSEAQKVTAELHVKDVITRLRNYQVSNPVGSATGRTPATFPTGFPPTSRIS